MITTRIQSKHQCNIPRTALALATSEKIWRAESFAPEKPRRFGAPNLFAYGQRRGSTHNYNMTSTAIYRICIAIISNMYVMCSLTYYTLCSKRYCNRTWIAQLFTMFVL